MKYTVIGRPHTINGLADLWLGAADREAVSLAAAQIDRLLGTDPMDQGESREDDTRVLLIKPLGVEYDVDEPDRKVQVNAVWEIG